MNAVSNVDNRFVGNTFGSRVSRVKETLKISAIVAMALEAYAVTKVGLKTSKASVGLAEEFIEVSVVVTDFFKFAKALKIIAGGMKAKKLASTANKFCKAKTHSARIVAIWQAVKCIKKITGAVETTLKFLRDFHVVSDAALCWTEIAGYIFLPITFISTAVSVHSTAKEALFVKELYKNTKSLSGRVKKQELEGEQKERILKACRFIVDSEKKFKSYKVLTKSCPLKSKMKELIIRVELGDEESIKADLAKAQHVIGQLKGRITHQFAINVAKTSLKVTGCTVTVVGLTTGVAALPAAIIDLVVAVGKLGLFVYAKHLPNHDPFEAAPPRIYQRVFTKVQTLCTTNPFKNKNIH